MNTLPLYDYDTYFVMWGSFNLWSVIKVTLHRCILIIFIFITMCCVRHKLNTWLVDFCVKTPGNLLGGRLHFGGNPVQGEVVVGWRRWVARKVLNQKDRREGKMSWSGPVESVNRAETFLSWSLYTCTRLHRRRNQNIALRVIMTWKPKNLNAILFFFGWGRHRQCTSFIQHA
jgi:hypothetical protein